MTYRHSFFASATQVGLRALWGLDDAMLHELDTQAAEAEVRRHEERQLLSFAACSSLTRDLREEAMLCRDTDERLSLAEAGLKECHKELIARLAIEGAIDWS